MDWGELLQGVGDWSASIADSTLVVGLIGAGAALLGGWISNRRARQERMEDRGREDVAAWRDKRHEAYASLWVLNTTMRARVSLLVTLVHRPYAPQDGAWEMAWREAEDAVDSYVDAIARLELMTPLAVYRVMVKVAGDAQTSFGMMPETWDSASSWHPEHQGALTLIMTDLQQNSRELFLRMKLVLRLPEDE